MAKKSKKAKAAVAAAITSTTNSDSLPLPISLDTASDLDQQIHQNRELFDKTRPKLTYILEENGTAISLPSSPVIKFVSGLTHSPALSASATQTFDKDFEPVLLPLAKVSEPFRLDVAPDFEWSSSNVPAVNGGLVTQAKAAEEEHETTVSYDTGNSDLPNPGSDREEGQSAPHQEQRPDQARSPAPKQSVEAASDQASSSFVTQAQAEAIYLPPYPYLGVFPRGHMAYHLPYGYGPPPNDGSPYQSPYPPFHYPYPHPRKLERHDSMASRGSGNGDAAGVSTPPGLITDSASVIEDDPSDLLGRLHLAIPDLELLLRRYKETHGELGVREALVRKKEAEALETIKRKEEHIDRLMSQFHDAEKKHAKEYNKLRFHIGNLEDIVKDLEERLHVSETKRKHEVTTNKELNEQKAALVRERMLVAKAAADERDKLIAEYEASKTDTEKQLDAERKRVAELTAKAHEAEVMGNASKAELESELRSTKANFEAEAVASKEAVDKALHDLETLKAELAAEKAANANGWEEKRAQLVSELAADKDAMAKEHEEAISALKKEHKSDLNEQTVAFVGLQESLNLKMTAENQSLIEEIANLKTAWNDDKAKFEKMIEDLRGVAHSMEEEKGRLEKIVDCFKEETDVKSKGDLHYIEAFAQLWDLISELCANHFEELPEKLSSEALTQVPANLPSILEDTVQGRESRHALVAHRISSTLLERVFTPFLFGLGQRQEETELLLEHVSSQLRAKNSRTEAVWRQHTLLAAYTTANAKLRMNKEAGIVIDVILAAILPYIPNHDRRIDDIRASVRKIVKLAVETWRYARLESDIIEAVMPALANEGEDDAEEYWLAYSSRFAKVGDLQRREKQMLLRIFPIIRRAKVKEGAEATLKERSDHGYIYSRGWALYGEQQGDRVTA